MKKSRTNKTVKVTEARSQKIARTTQNLEETSIGKKAGATKIADSKRSKSSPLGITKEYTKSHKICCATFRLPREAALKA